MKQYQKLIKQILDEGSVREDRTGKGTVGIFHAELDVSLNNGFPLMTHKFVSFKSVIAELLWFMSGDTNVKSLHKLNVHFWDAWADEDGDLGPVYGAQWRGKTNGVDQLANVIHAIIHNPTSRRLLIDSWVPELLPRENLPPAENPKDIQNLPPCHFAFQFYVRQGKYLELKWYQR